MNAELLKKRLAARKALGMTAEEYNQELERRIAAAVEEMQFWARRSCFSLTARGTDEAAVKAIEADALIREAKADRDRGYSEADLPN